MIELETVVSTPHFPFPLIKKIYPFSPQTGPQEFLIIQYGHFNVLPTPYPTTVTPWSSCYGLQNGGSNTPAI